MKNLINKTITDTIKDPTLSFVLIGLCFLILGTVFYFVTNDVLDLMIGSEVWTFYLLLFLSALFSVIYHAMRSMVSVYIKYLLIFFVIALIIATTVIGIMFKPFHASNIELKLGAEPILINPNLPTADSLSPEELGHLKEAEPEISWKHLAPQPIDQGICGSCVVMSLSFAANTRENIKRQKNGIDIINEKITDKSCVKSTSDLKWWYISPQHIIDRMTYYKSTDDLKTGKISGKCIKNNVKDVVDKFMQDDTYPLSCIPLYSSVIEYDSTVGGGVMKCNECKHHAPLPSLLDSSTMCFASGSFEHEECYNNDIEAIKNNITLKPYNQSNVFNSEQMIMNEITNNGPVVCQINFYNQDNKKPIWTVEKNSSLFGNYAPIETVGHVSQPKNDPYYTSSWDGGGHAITVTGYGITTSGVKFWEFANSWGKGFGTGGYSKIERGINAWNIESHCYAPQLT